MSNLPAISENINKAEAALTVLMENPEKFNQTKMLFLSQIKANPKLAKCSPDSLMNCLKDIAQYNLDLTKNSAFLVPYGNSATLQLGYKGYEQIAMRCGSKGIKPAIVFEDDEFEIDLAAGVVVTHKPGETRENIKGAYAQTTMKNGETYAVYFSKSELDKRKSKSKSLNYWGNGYEGMARKTCVIALCKLLPNFNHDFIQAEYTEAAPVGKPIEVIEQETLDIGEFE